MVAPKVLEEMLRIIGKPDRVHLTGNYNDVEKAAASKIEMDEGFAPSHVRVTLDVSADDMTVKQLLALYRKNYADFNYRFDSTGKVERMSNLYIKELVWFKNDVKNGVIQSDKEHYYVTFNRYHFRGRINITSEPKLVQKLLLVMKKHSMHFPVSFGS
jgi:hypothetical protein